ncbi:MAG: hypothetical protein ACRCY9_23275, partial [Phycicoccus sp.]
MFHPDDDLLADVALGEPAARFTREHLTSCSACATEVEALSRTLAVLRVAPAEPVAPPPRVWDAVQAAVLLDDAPVLLDDAPADARVGAPTLVNGEPGSFADRHAPVTELRTRRAAAASRRSHRRVGAGWLAAAAAVGVLGGGVGVAALGGDDRPTEPASVVL